ncbi:hypothetical protein [Mesoterricola silvestris]|uniref:PD-(D/E)XK nuclease family transposase n=1 Tax=Mesoterricola silvestris TaxID=2927979 RepID=A0AA48H244_9BACT|nr:hypothetical protein [Mesoterricola silvestris]BDU74608.1 hypothetical protein METEAL_37820 [Mesoterricola silvestris]
MSVANPIYDVVFKFLLDDERIARMLLSALLGREVVELSFVPTETREPVARPDGTSLLVLRMDFAAKVLMEDGSRKLVLIEIQKARDTSDIQRFRRYLGTSYADPRNSYRDAQGVELPLPILTIYFLGEGLKGLDLPVLRVDRRCWDPATGDEVRIADPFVEALTHDSVIIQMNRLKDRRRTDLERLLEVFDQGVASHTDPHFLDILEVNFPERYRDVLRRLKLAYSEPGLRVKMDLEDEILHAFQERAREAADLRIGLSSRDRVISDQGKALADKDRVIEDKDRLIEDKNRLLEDKDRTIVELLRRLDAT